MRTKNGDSKEVVSLNERLDGLFAERQRIESQIEELLDGSFLRTKEVAERFCVSNRSVCNWVAHGQLKPAGKHPDLGYLFSVESVESFTPPPKGNPRHREMHGQRGN